MGWVAVSMLWMYAEDASQLPSVCPQTFSGPVDLPESSYPKQPVNDSLPWLHTEVPRAEECWMETCGLSET